MEEPLFVGGHEWIEGLVSLWMCNAGDKLVLLD
jgi:hypothetical protein